MAECPNDCRTPLVFPLPIHNRPGLSRIGYRIGTYTKFREVLLHYLDQSPELAPWTYRGSDDPGIALVEAASVVGDILTFYQDLYANEVYLPTATLSQSVAGLVRLVGYRLSPGVGGNATFAFQITGSTPIAVPARFPITADLAALPDTVTFETTIELAAVPALSKFALYQPFTVGSITSGADRLAIDTAALAGTALEKNTRLMLISGDYRQIAVIDDVEHHFEQTEITLKGGWQGPAAATITAYVLGRDFRHFGYNAPTTQTVVKSGTATQEPVSFSRTVGSLHILGSGTLGSGTSPKPSTYKYNPLPDGSYFPLDSAPDDISAGATFLLSLDVISFLPFTSGAENIFAAVPVVSAEKASITVGPLTGASTVIHLNGLVTHGFLDYTDIRSVQIHETTGGPFTLRAPRRPIPGPTSRLFFYGNGQDYRTLDGRLLQLQRNKPDPGQPEAVEQATATITPSQVGDLAHVTLRPVTLAPAPQRLGIGEFPLSFPKDDPPVWVYANVVAATQGKTEKPVVLGNGDSRASYLTFPIPKVPLTNLLSASATPPQVPQLVVTVDDIEWTPVASLISAGPKDQVYIVREDSTGKSFVQFGDGETGARPPSGVGNVAATYRTGIQAHGPLKPGASADAGAKIRGLDAISMLDDATGGAPPEDPANARQAAPGKIQSLGRLVSLRDFETETLGIPGVTAASAAWQIVDGVPAVAVTVLTETGRSAEIKSITTLLNNYNICRGPQRFPVVVIPGRRAWTYAEVSVALVPSYQEADVFDTVRDALNELFSVSRGFGAREYRSRIEGIIQNVTGVAWNDVTALGSLGPSDDPTALTLPAPPRARVDTLPCDATTMLALYPAHLTLSVVAAPVEVC